MYIDCSLGELVFRLRSDLRITQEKLCDGICTAGTISRIENGSQEPTAPMFQRILERLGEPGFFRGFYQNKHFLKHLELKRKILECYEYNDLRGLDRAISQLAESCKPVDVSSIQFLRIIELIYLKSYEKETFDSIKELESIMSMSHKRFSADDNLKGYLFDYTELLILNHMAWVYMVNGKTDLAGKILKFMAESLDRNKHFLPEHWKLKSGVYNNLAVCEMVRGNLKGAMISIDKACGLSSLEGGLYFRLKLIRTRFKIKKNGGFHGEAKKDELFLRYGYEELSAYIKNNIKLEEFLKKNCFLSVF